jgi:hypothetical protein
MFLSQRIHLDIQVGEHAIDYAQVAQKEKLSELQLRLRQLMDQVEQITKEQNYQRVCFFSFHEYPHSVKAWFSFDVGAGDLCSIARNVSARRASPPTSVFSGGLSARSQFSSSSAFGR